GPKLATASQKNDDDTARTAVVSLPNGIVISVDNVAYNPSGTFHIVATEYTVGAKGPKQMPADLPPASGYTYAVELAIPEVASTSSITFNKPVSFYVDNFMGIPTGQSVPVGYYDKTKAAWIPSASGMVIAIVGITNMMANLDLTGDGV